MSYNYFTTTFPTILVSSFSIKTKYILCWIHLYRITEKRANAGAISPKVRESSGEGENKKVSTGYWVALALVSLSLFMNLTNREDDGKIITFNDWLIDNQANSFITIDDTKLNNSKEGIQREV